MHIMQVLLSLLSCLLFWEGGGDSGVKDEEPALCICIVTQGVSWPGHNCGAAADCQTAFWQARVC